MLLLGFVLIAGGKVMAVDHETDQIAANKVAFVAEQGKLRIEIDGRPFATYVYEDEQILRPYFSDVFTPSGVKVTRNHPPIEGQDRTDHATFHPGLWLAFGDLDGADFWRNRATVRHVKFIGKPTGGPAHGRFAVLNRYEAAGRVICEETCELTVLVRPSGYLLLWDSKFSSGDADFSFGDQEEMGLGVRVATPISVIKGGRIINSDGLKNESQAWGKQADWCDDSGIVGNHRIGVTLMPDPRNFRHCWFHARDYGLLLANPFGRNAFTQGKKSKLVVRRGETLRLRFGALVHGTKADQAFNLPDAYDDYLEQTGANH